MGDSFKCEKCGTKVFWRLSNKTGNWYPANKFGKPHFLDCERAVAKKKEIADNAGKAARLRAELDGNFYRAIAGDD